MVFVYGSASSGKSDIAEKIAVMLSDSSENELIYMATMENKSSAAKERIKRHREKREGKGFHLIEETNNLSSHLSEVSGKTVLLECVSNLVGNVLFDAVDIKVASDQEILNIAAEITKDILNISASADRIIVVSNDIFSDGIVYDDWTEAYMKLLGMVNIMITEKSQYVINVVNGIPCFIKGDKFEIC